MIAGSYFGKRHYEEAFARGGLEMTFHGWKYPLSDYTRAFEGAGFLIEAAARAAGAQAARRGSARGAAPPHPGVSLPARRRKA